MQLSDNLSDKKGDASVKDFWVLVGAFGSGKSELALNMAVCKAAQEPCTLIDLDVINPYFRTSERFDVLNAAGVELISPPFAMQKIEILSVSPRVYSAFTPGEGSVIFDVGGDHIGAVALGQYKPNFNAIPQERLNVLFVVNPLRPLASDLPGALSLLDKIQQVSRLSITGIVNNANLAEQTTLSHLVDGYELVRELSKKTGVPVWGTCGTGEVLEAFQQYASSHQLDEAYIGQYYPIEVMMHRSWDKFLKEGL